VSDGRTVAAYVVRRDARKPEAAPLAVHLAERADRGASSVVQGCAPKMIARRLGLAVGTVKTHLAGIYRVPGAHSWEEAIARASGAHVQAAGGGGIGR
jgi:DNA-binding NarL/FixJ family response regulator